MSKQRTITLTGRPPVRIQEDAWPVIAQAYYDWHDGQVESQANRKKKWSVRVRQHDDGRAIIYASYHYDTHYQGEDNMESKAGRLLGVGADEAAIVAAINQVCEDIAELEHAEGDAAKWKAMAADCIADMPAEELK